MGKQVPEDSSYFINSGELLIGKFSVIRPPKGARNGGERKTFETSEPRKRIGRANTS